MSSEKEPSSSSSSSSAQSGKKRKADAAPALRRYVGFNTGFVSLTTHPHTGKPVPIKWGSSDPKERGPVIAVRSESGSRNAVGAHGGSYCVYTALAVLDGRVPDGFVPNLRNTEPAFRIGPHPSWGNSDAFKGIMSFDPFGHMIQESFSGYLEKGIDVRPTIAVTRAHIDLPEIKMAMAREKNALVADGAILKDSGQLVIGKAAVEPVWYLPGIAKRFNCTEEDLRQALFERTNGMYPELLTRTDMKVFLPPIGGLTIYLFGDISAITDPEKEVAVRVHDECNGSDVFGSDICTCRPYLIHGIEVCVRTAQQGGCGIIVYFRKEGRALGEVTKYLVYNLRKRQKGGDKASEYFNCTAEVAGMEDARFQSFMPDALLWLGVTKIDKLMSMSDMKYNAITKAGIEVKQRIPIPPEMVPKDAQVEINAKVYAGYNGGSTYRKMSMDELEGVQGRSKDEFGA
eukprot:g4290.t1